MAIMLNPNAIPKGSITQEMIDASAFEGIYELLTAGYALNLVGKGNGEPQAFLSRKTGGGNITDGSAVIKEVDGVQPIVWNQLVKNGNFANGATGWFFDGSGSVSNNEATVTATGSVTGAYCRPSIIKEHKYLIEVDVKVSELKPVRAYFGVNINSGVSTPITTANLYVKCTGIVKAIQDENLLQINSNLSVGETITIKNVCCIDLTQMFGAGNEPSTYDEYLDRISHYHIKDAYAYNAGEVVNYRGTGIKTTGRNIWDEEWESGRLDKGENITGPAHFRSKNFISVDPTKQYFIRAKSCFVSEYDANKTFIEQRDAFTDVAISLPANCRYIRFWSFNQPTYNHDICINLSDPAFNGQYEPYRSYVRDWSEVMQKYFPDGMTSLNGVKDFFNEKKAVRKWGCKVFDGTEAWAIDGIHFYVQIKEDMAKKGYNTSLKCAMYSQASGASEYNNDKIISAINAYYEKNIIINDSAFTSFEAWKAHLADLYAQGNPLVVYYELAEPVEDIFEKPLNLTYTVINGGTETSLATENSTQFEGSIFYGKDYVGVIDELQLQNRVTQIEFENWEN